MAKADDVLKQLTDDDVIDIMTEEVENSSFFRALNKTAETEDAENTSEQGKEEKKERSKN